MLRRPFLVLVVAAVVPVGAYAATASRDGASGRAAEEPERAACDVAGPKPGSAITGTFGKDLTVMVPPAGDAGIPPGATEGRARTGGAISAKILWRRDPEQARGRLRVTGRQRGGARAVLRVRLDQGHRRITPSTLVFSSEGCWSVRARAGRTRVRYVVRVVGRSSGD